MIIPTYLLGLFEVMCIFLMYPMLMAASLASFVYDKVIANTNRDFTPQPNEKLAVVITGASAGIGKSLAIHYAKRYGRSNRLCFGLIATRGELLQKLATKLHEKYGIPKDDIMIRSVDIKQSEPMTKFMEEFEAKYNGINVLIANAGVTEGMLMERTPDISFADSQREVLGVNMLGTLNTVLPVVNKLIGKKRYIQDQKISICIVSSVSFSISKLALYPITKRAAMDYALFLRKTLEGNPYVNVMTVLPGWVGTNMSDSWRGVKPAIVTPDVAADQIREAIESGEGLVATSGLSVYFAGRILDSLPYWLYEPISKISPPYAHNGRF